MKMNKKALSISLLKIMASVFSEDAIVGFIGKLDVYTVNRTQAKKLPLGGTPICMEDWEVPSFLDRSASILYFIDHIFPTVIRNFCYSIIKI